MRLLKTDEMSFISGGKFTCSYLNESGVVVRSRVFSSYIQGDLCRQLCCDLLLAYRWNFYDEFFYRLRAPRDFFARRQYGKCVSSASIDFTKRTKSGGSY